MPTVSLTDLQQQISQREQELQALREELQTRQSQLSDLTRRREELQSQLRQVEQEIASLAATTTATEQPAPAATKAAPAAPIEGQPRLGDLIVTLLREAAQPMTGRQLMEEAQRRGYQPTSHEPLKAMENRLQVLKSQGIVRRASGQYGFILAASSNGSKQQKSKASQPTPTSIPKKPSQPTKAEPATKKSSGKGASAAKATQTTKPGRRGGQPPLRVVLTDILKKSRKPLSGSELAKLALKAGYQTTSEKFVDSVWAMLAQMKNVEHLPQQGYRLNKS